MNKPVAWAYIKDGEFWDAVHPDEHDRYEGMYTTPLYTHPVKELSDEEIDKVIQENKNKCLIDICREVIRGAQEK